LTDFVRGQEEEGEGAVTAGDAVVVGKEGREVRSQEKGSER